MHYFYSPFRHRECILHVELSATSQRLRISGCERNPLEAADQKKRQHFDTKMGLQSGRGASQGWQDIAQPNSSYGSDHFAFSFPSFGVQWVPLYMQSKIFPTSHFCSQRRTLSCYQNFFYHNLYAGRLPKCK